MLVSRRTERCPGPDAPGVTVLRPEGDLDALKAPEIRRAVLALPPGARLVVDLGATAFIDSVGVGLLIGAWRTVVAHGGSVVLAGPRPPVARVLQVTGVMEVIPVVDAAAEAVRLPVGRVPPPRSERIAITSLTKG